MSSSWAIHDATTGEILRTIIGSSDLADENLESGEAKYDAAGELVSSQNRYVDDPGGTPSLADRSDMGATLPEVVTEGADLFITGVPDGATILVEQMSDASEVHSGTKGGGMGTYDAATTGAVEGDRLLVTVSKFPLKSVSGIVEVIAP